jgi:hypothetical protein
MVRRLGVLIYDDFAVGVRLTEVGDFVARRDVRNFAVDSGRQSGRHVASWKGTAWRAPLFLPIFPTYNNCLCADSLRYF